MKKPHSKIDQIFIKNFIDNVAVGYYAVAVKLSEIWYLVPILSFNAVFPAIVNAKRVSQELYERRLSKIYFYFFWCSIIVAIIFTFSSNIIVKNLFGTAYIPSIKPMIIYNWTLIGYALSVVLSNCLIIDHKTKFNFIINGLSAVSNILLNLIFIPRFGIIGAAYATVISYFVLLASLNLFKSTRQYWKFLIRSIFVYG